MRLYSVHSASSFHDTCLTTSHFVAMTTYVVESCVHEINKMEIRIQLHIKIVAPQFRHYQYVTEPKHIERSRFGCEICEL